MTILFKMNHFSEHERLLIYRGLEIGEKKRVIAKRLGRSHTSVDREILRNSSNTGKYDPFQAESMYRDRRTKANKTHCKLLKDLVLRDEIERRLGSKEEDWSPDDLMGRMKDEGAPHVCTKTVYNYINQYNPTWKKYLKYKWGYRKAKRGLQRKVNTNLPSIDERPAIVDMREREGDREADTVISKGRNSAFLTCNERKVKYVLIKKVPDCKAMTIHEATLAVMSQYKDRMFTVTIDNGKEFGDAEITQVCLGVQYYKAHPYHSWERGSNEHTNGMIRKWIPKGTDFSSMTEEEVEQLQTKLNKKPRKILNYATPYELFHHVKLSYFSHMCISK